jgi:L-threo-3-deoxy-hexylosonate aldolase
LSKASISGTKCILEKLYGYGGLPRRPLPPMDPNTADDLWNHPHIQTLIELERGLKGGTNA